jgi:hypothetical protein
LRHAAWRKGVDQAKKMEKIRRSTNGIEAVGVELSIQKMGQEVKPAVGDEQRLKKMSIAAEEDDVFGGTFAGEELKKCTENDGKIPGRVWYTGNVPCESCQFGLRSCLPIW